ncbi:collagen triple helix repeat (20 copies) domain-containing protein [Sarocladium implicatum]|nr:collagen triple helix repeat (20 copies) domain-containing protein [Sarocladium implicatum]
MSNLVHKIKDAVTSDKKHEEPTGTHGHHDNRAANAADPRIDSDRDGRANPAGPNTTGTAGGFSSGTTGTHGSSGLTGTTGTHGTSAGVGGLDNRGLGGPATRTDGPHGSNLANKADPRVDSDRDHSRNLGANPSGTASTGNYTSTTGTHGSSGLAGTTGTHGTSGLTGSTGTHGTHGTSGLTGSTGTHGTHGTSGLTGSTGTSGLTGTTGTHGTAGGINTVDNRGLGGPATRTDGPHGSNLANKADPRVDSDRDHSRNLGANPSGTASTGNYTSTTGTHGSSGLAGTTGTHGSSGLTGTHGTHGTHGTTTGSALGSGPGPAANTAGPHKSDLLNKADPRVDSNLDGSKTVGQDKTFTQSNNTLQGKDPTDAAQVPPSVLRKSIGDPEIAHKDAQHARDARHSVSHQEEHRGL